MVKLLMAGTVGLFLAGPAAAQTVIVEEPAPTTTTRTTTTVTSIEGALPGDAMPGDVVTYVQENPIDSAPVLEGRLVNGTIVPEGVSLAPVQGYSGYSYFYQDGTPVIVNSERRVIQVVR